ncbi:MAG: cytochrome c [Cyclobacteriaceae bacterium]|nr:cytochrome c [Cyclobacteriaceae bacterium]
MAKNSTDILCTALLVVILALIFSSSCNPSKQEEKNKFTNYFRQGEQLYVNHCSNCHQINGTGLGRVYPPLSQSDYMQENFESVLCLMRHGIEGELMVNGKQYNQPMPGIPTLTDLEIAEIATYIYNTWGNSRGIIDVKDAERILQGCNKQ